MKHEWQYDGVTSWTEIVQWCVKNFGYNNNYVYPVPENRRWKAQWETIYFQRDEDYVLFLLRWG